MQITNKQFEGSSVIALTGASGSGKDTVAEYLASDGYERIAVADRLKHAVQFVFGLTDTQLWGDERDLIVARLGLTPRELYQRFSDACRALDGEVWTRPFEAELRSRQTKGRRTVWTDVRTEAELMLAQRVGATVVRVLRPGAAAKGEAAAHPTETAMAALPDHAFDVVIHNEGSIAELYRNVDRLLLGVAS